MTEHSSRKQKPEKRKFTNVCARGYIRADCDGKEKVVNVVFHRDHVVFQHRNISYDIKFGVTTCIADCVFRTRSGNTYAQKVFDGFRDALRQIVQKPRKFSVSYGEVTLSDVPLLLVVMPNGFLFCLDLDQATVTYALAFEDGRLVLAWKDGDWEAPQEGKDANVDLNVMGECRDYVDALEQISRHAKRICREFADETSLH